VSILVGNKKSFKKEKYQANNYTKKKTRIFKIKDDIVINVKYKKYLIYS